MVAFGPAQNSPFQNRTCEDSTGPAQHPSDKHLQRRVLNYLALRNIDGLECIRFTIMNGNVLLRGMVASASIKWRICEGCRHVAGVLNVIDRLIVTPGLQSSLIAVR